MFQNTLRIKHNLNTKGKKTIPKVLLLVVLFLILFIEPSKVYGADNKTLDDSDFDYTEIQKVVDDVFKSEDKMNFQEYVTGLVSGETKFSLKEIGNDIKDSIVGEIKGNIGTLTRLISIAIVAAVFTNFSYAFSNNQVAETGFYVAYLLLFSILTGSFITAASMASETLTSILDFMKALIPAYFLSVAFSSGAGTSLVYYQATLFLITFVDILLIKLVIPMINIYLIVSMANNISKEDFLSKLTELLSQVVKWLLKSLLALVIGFNTIQGLILPVSDRIKKSTLLKAAGAIPGVGDVLGTVTESVIGAGILLKNAIGVAGVVVIIVICAIPVLKLTVTTLIYRISSAAVQPISDKRMLNCVIASAEASTLLLQTILVGGVLFLLTITIIAASTTY
jgi:stage III sporulation protein AE